MGRSIDARRAPQLAAMLLGTTILAGVPAAAFAQSAAAANAPAAAPVAAEAATPIQTIQVVGAERLEPQTVLSYIKLRVGQPYTKAAADGALKDLYATELFADAQIANDNGVVTITVKENPVVNRIILEGNKRIKDDKIMPEIKVAPRQIFTRSKIRADVARIIELYKRQGRYAATVEPKMVMLDQNRVDIVFEITEGDKSKVRQINIIGNEHFSDGDLRSQMVTKQARFSRVFSSNTTYDPDRMAFDQQKLRQFYLTQGYADFRVVSAVAELTPDKKDFIITYVVEEGKRYKFGDVKVESQLRDFDGDKLAKNLAIHKGDWYNAKLVEDTIEGLNDTAGAFGYAFADVRPQYSRDKDDLTMGLTFVIQEAPRVYVERIDINGNTLTQDKVVRREFRLAEGDAFNSLQVKRSTNRIKSLGYFQEKFEVEQKPGSADDRVVLEANVEEKPTGQLQLSAGFSSLERFIFQASIQQRNFRGRGQTIGLSGSYSSYSKSVEANFVEPYLFDKNVSLGLDIYRRDYNSFNYINSNRNTNYSQTTTGFQVRAGVPLTEYLTAIARYTLNYDDVSVDKSTYYSYRVDPSVYQCDPLYAGRYLCDALGKRLSSILGGSIIYDTLDNRVRPTRGQTASINVDVAGLGGDVKYARATLANSNKSDFARRYGRAAGDVDAQIARVLDALRESGKLDNTVVIVTAGHGVPLGDETKSMSWSRPNLQVPLVIHWPGTPAQRITMLTEHKDVMTTLMQRLLHVSTPANEYSQGQDLFSAARRHNWVTAAGNNTLVVTTPKLTLVLNSNGNYQTYNLQGERLKDQKPQLSLLLQVLTDEKRFVAN